MVKFEYTYDYNLVSKVTEMESGILIAISIDNFPYIVSNDNVSRDYEDYVIKIQEVLSEHLNATVIRHSDHVFFILTEQEISVHNEVFPLIRNFNNQEGHNIFLKCVLGYCIFSCNQKTTNTHPISNALAALKFATKTNVFCVNYDDYASHFHLDDTKNNHELPKFISSAIDSGSLVMYARPIIDIHNGKIEMYESFLSIKDLPKQKKIREIDIIRSAEEFNLIGILDNIACKMVRNQTAHDANNKFITKISLKSCISNYWLTDFFSNIQDLPLAKRMVIEIHGEYSHYNKKEIVSFINKLKDLGCKIMFNTSGIAIGRMTEILNLRVDFVKIDERLIEDIENNPVTQNIVKFLSDFFYSIGSNVIATGITNDTQVEILKNLKIQYLQGPLFGKEIPIDQLL
ncbi:EAL domain-containing protein [Anaplasmataceae bacterium AB001_6]|nr:EAL domain-containing protein [Anaplasmataceae bacterium AB001_6]